MNKDYITYYKVIGEINDIVNKSNTIEEVFNEVVKVLIDSLHVKYATIWFKDKNNNLQL